VFKKLCESSCKDMEKKMCFRIPRVSVKKKEVLFITIGSRPMTFSE
jgi:hypothetical protein